MRNCPYCAEKIEDDALFCKHCGREAAAIETPGKEEKKPPSLPKKAPKAERASSTDDKSRPIKMACLGFAITVVLAGSCITVCFFLVVVSGILAQ